LVTPGELPVCHNSATLQSVIEDLGYSENMGAYRNASSTWSNAFPPATIVHVNS
jgi:hypothetical protein